MYDFDKEISMKRFIQLVNALKYADVEHHLSLHNLTKEKEKIMTHY